MLCEKIRAIGIALMAGWLPGWQMTEIQVDYINFFAFGEDTLLLQQYQCISVEFWVSLL